MLLIAVKKTSFRIKRKVNMRSEKCIPHSYIRYVEKIEGSNRMVLSWM